MNRRDFLAMSAGAAAGILLGGEGFAMQGPAKKGFGISLAEWSFHKAIFGGELDHLDFAARASELGCEGVEYVNTCFMDKAGDRDYLSQMKRRAEDNGVVSLLIMCDREGHLGDPDEGKRRAAVENHYKWLEAAKYLGCHSIRVNAHSQGSYEEQMKLAADGLSRLSEKGAEYGLNVIVENHGGLSSTGEWLVGVMEAVGMDNCGILPDFGNFDEGTDRYEAVRSYMPYAKAVSAKSHKFDANGDEVNTDYYKMMKIVLGAGYHGFVGIEYEGSELSESDGIIATRKLLEKIRKDYVGGRVVG